MCRQEGQAAPHELQEKEDLKVLSAQLPFTDRTLYTATAQKHQPTSGSCKASAQRSRERQQHKLHVSQWSSADPADVPTTY